MSAQCELLLVVALALAKEKYQAVALAVQTQRARGRGPRGRERAGSVRPHPAASASPHFLAFFFEAPKNDIIDFMPFLSTFASFLAAWDVGALLVFCRSPQACGVRMRIVVHGVCVRARVAHSMHGSAHHGTSERRKKVRSCELWWCACRQGRTRGRTLHRTLAVGLTTM